jgi:DNA polymerase (family 10)
MKQVKLFGADEEPKVLTSLELAKAKAIALKVEESIKPLCEKLKIVGSLRREKTAVGDCDFVIVATDTNWAKIAQVLKKSKVICAGPSVTKLNIPCESSLFQVDFYRATSQTFGIQELIRTGSADHNMWLASYALSKGFRLKYSSGLIKDEVAVAGETEESVFRALGLPCPEPQQREVVDGKPIWMKLEKQDRPPA